MHNRRDLLLVHISLAAGEDQMLINIHIEHLHRKSLLLNKHSGLITDIENAMQCTEAQCANTGAQGLSDTVAQRANIRRGPVGYCRSTVGIREWINAVPDIHSFLCTLSWSTR